MNIIGIAIALQLMSAPNADFYPAPTTPPDDDVYWLLDDNDTRWACELGAYMEYALLYRDDGEDDTSMIVEVYSVQIRRKGLFRKKYEVSFMLDDALFDGWRYYDIYDVWELKAMFKEKTNDVTYEK